MKELGIKVNVVKDRQAFVDRVKPLWQKYRKIIGDSWFDRVANAK